MWARRQYPLLCGLLAGLALAGCGPALRRPDPDASEKRALLGADYLSKGLVQPALVELLKAIDLDPKNADAHNMLGLVFLRRGAESEELATRNQCLKGEALHLEKQRMDQQFGEAEGHFRRAIDLRDDFSEARNNLAVVMLHFGRSEEAVALEERALANILYREPFFAQGNLGQAYYDKRDYVRAAQALRRALFAQPKFCVGRYWLAKVLAATGEWDRVAEELEQVVSDRACPIQEAFHLAGVTALHRRDAEEARRLFDRCIELAPKSCVAAECRVGLTP